MTRAAILSPSTLLGREVRDLLDDRPELAGTVALLSTGDVKVGTVSETRGAPALVAEATAETLADADVIFACGTLETDLPLVEARPDGATAILLSPAATASRGRPVIAGVNPEDAEAGSVLVSPHPAAIALAYLLAPLAELVPESAAATVVQPVSLLGDRGLEDLLDQTRDILAMAGERGESIFDRQLAFNVYPAPEGAARMAELVRGATGGQLPLAVHALQGAVFHGVSVSLFVRFGTDPGEERLRGALAGQEHVTVSAADVEACPGPIDAAARDDVLVGSVRPDAGAPGGYWIWAVIDNITRGGALNAVEVAERVMGVEK